MQSVQFMYKIKQYVHHEQENQERNKSLILEFKGKTKDVLVNLLECPNYMSVWCLYNTCVEHIQQCLDIYYLTTLFFFKNALVDVCQTL